MTLFVAFLTVCGDSGSDGPDPAVVCDTICQKQDTCDLLGNNTLEDCRTECRDYAGYMLDSYLAATADCFTEKTCEELAITATPQDACYEDNVDLCTTDTSEYVEAACLKDFECDGITDPTPSQMDDCTRRMHADGNILICFEPFKINELQACVENATFCNPNPIRTCVKDVVGVELGTGGSGG
jgi:hypothetical protein